MAEVSFGEWLKRRRGAEGWTQEQLAQKIHCSASALRKFESEERRPSAEVVEQIAEIFNIPGEERASFLRFARGDWQAFGNQGTEAAPWHVSNIKSQSKLPSSISSFIGRETEQSEVVDLLQKNRLVTLAGIGGIGKTRLAIQVGYQLQDTYPDGVWFIPLDSLSEPFLIPQTVASAFDIREGADQTVLEILKIVLHRKTLLLILDNCEHLLEACAGFINNLLIHCQDLKVLTTSRETLNLTGEAIYYLPSLSIPQARASLESLAEYEAVELFIERAALTLPTFQLTEENAPAIVDICRRVDGIPLAIELTAAHVNILSVDEISKQLHQSFALLRGDQRNAPSRHQTLQASLDWSLSLLTQEEQVFLCQLSVFAGGWTLDASQAVCEGNVLSLTNSLVKKSLIFVDQQPGHDTRYRFHEIVRQYMHQKLVESDETKVHTPHLKYFSHLAEQAEQGLRGHDQRIWHTRLIDERDNIRAALEWAAKTDTKIGLYLAGRLQGFWESLDLMEGMHWLATFLDKPESKNYSQARARALHTKAMLLWWMQKNSLSTAQESLDLFRSCGDISGEIDALLMVAIMLAITDDHNQFSESIKLFQQALELAKSHGDQWRQAQVLRFLVYHVDYPDRISYTQEAVTLFKKAGDLELSIDQMISLAGLELESGNPQSAQSWLDEAVRASQDSTYVGTELEVSKLDTISTLSQRLRNKPSLAYTLFVYGTILFRLGKLEEAYASLSRSIEMGQELGNRIVYLFGRTQLGYLFLQQGDSTKARTIFVDSAQNFQKDKNTIGVAFSLEGIASIFVMNGKPAHAASLLGWADGAREKAKDMRPPFEQRDVDQTITACLANLGESAFSDAYEEGKGMSLEEAVEHALEKS